jgi:hypothetical protein
MAALQIKSFGGVSPKVPPRYLQDTMAQTALNAVVFNGSLQPLSNVGVAVHTLTKVGTPLTIYRFGQDSVSDSQYWFHWTSDVDVCRSQISGDTSEWTFYTGDGAPKATYGQIALSGSNYPTVSRPLGLPAPTAALAASPSVFTPTTSPAEVILTSTAIGQLSTSYGIQISIVGTADGDYTTVTLTSPITASSVASAVNAAAGVAAVVEGTGVKITSDATGDSAKLYVRYRTGATANPAGTVTYSGLDLQATGTANTTAFLVITDAEIGSIDTGDTIEVSTLAGGIHVNDPAPSTFTATTLATWLNSQMTGEVVATAYGSCVVLTPGTQGGGASGVIAYDRYVDYAKVIHLESRGSDAASPASVIVTQANVDSVENRFLSVLINGTENFVAVPGVYTVNNLAIINGYGGSVEIFGSVAPFAIVSTTATGTSASIRLRGGDYPTVAQYSSLNATGVTETQEVPESRVYAWTWVNKEAGFEFESAPSPASATVEVRVEQSVAISGREVVPTGYVVTHWRLYRAVSGVYLFVAELPASQTSYTDSVLAESLGEELPSLTWLPPPATLRGLINLPNGIMAGFTGRDVYFCDPYHPHAWPVQYNQTVDFPVVGLGRMDTTLAVLTTGTPYFIQGSSPDAMVVVKSDLEQACASKRSIVSTNNSVIYASPDGLVLLSSSGSRLLTEQMFSRALWQEAFNPSSIHAYQQDMKYVAFYNNGVTAGGFIFDLTSGHFIYHNIYATAGYNDLQADKLYTAFSDRTVKIWQAGSALSYIWRSKKFTMPQIMGFSCAQVEAEAYPVTAKIYSDGTLVHTQTVASRTPFRLPATPGRDWEFQIEGNTEVFAVLVAQSMQELANG